MGRPSNETGKYRWRDLAIVVQILGAAAFVVIAALAAADLVADLEVGATFLDLTLDVAVTVGALAASAFFGWHASERSRQVQALLRERDDARSEAERWRVQSARLLPALGEAIRRQLLQWDLTPDEQRIALLLLSGLSTKDIAHTIATTPWSVRQQTLSIYGKAGVLGRTALSAFFLRDLLFLTGNVVPAAGGSPEGPRSR